MSALKTGDVVVLCDGGRYPLLNEGLWVVISVGVCEPDELPVLLVQLIPHPKPLQAFTIRTTPERCALLNEIWSDLRLKYEQ